MANIVTGFVRLIPIPSHKGYLPVSLPIGDILNLLLLNSRERRSYHVPIVVRQDEVSLMTDIQFGGAWGVTAGLEDIWYDYESSWEAIWVREFDSGGDHDRITWLDHSDASYQRFPRCRYGFDSIRITWKPDTSPEDFGLQWIKGENVWSLALQGSYFAGNDRCNLLLDHPKYQQPMKTPTTLTRGRASSGLEWELDELQPAIPDLLSYAETNADTIEFFWKQRLVRFQKREATIRYASRSKPGWHKYCLDDWDNCVDSDWLAFNEKSPQNPVTPPENDNEQTP